MSSIDPSKEAELKQLLSDGKKLASEGKLIESLKKLQLANEIQSSEKTLYRIERLKSALGYDPSCSENGKPDKKGTNIEQPTHKSIQSISSSDLSPTSLSKFKELRNQAKQLAYSGQYKEAVSHFQQALRIYNCPNTKKYMQEVQKVICSEAIKADSVEQPDADIQNTEVIPEVPKEHISSPDSELCESSLAEKLEKVKELYEEARDLASDGCLEDAVKILQKAQSFHKTEKVRKRIEKLQEYIAKDVINTEEDAAVQIDDGFSIHHAIYNKLYPYQREGVRWMWNLYKKRKGGILADDMGLGKTFQVIAFLSGLIDAGLVKHVLIIMPVTLIPTWESEFKKWCPGIAVHCFHGTTVKLRNRNLLRAQRGGHVVLTTYGLVLHNIDALTTMEGNSFVWDYLILDEGHKIKNPTKTTKAIYDIPSKNRLVLTATPIQNNLREMWSLFDFALQGTLLGSSKTFKNQYENPISRAREKDATAGEKRFGTEMAENLKSLINPYFLRRIKDDEWKKQLEEVEQQMDKLTITSLKKNDLILWTFMSDTQLEIYKDFLHSDAVKSILLTKRSPLVQLTILKKICDHPRLLSQRACLQLGLGGELQDHELVEKIEDESTAAPSIQNVSDEKLLEESGKLNLTIALLENLKASGHRTLVFSMSRKILDMIHRILINRHWKVLRLDGTITSLAEREKRIAKFQKDSTYPVFLLTTQVGGVGLTLTAANRVIIYDPSWNPASDAQAVDRAFRIGQEKNVVIYRLITCGTVEEKIYRRQVFKDSITRQTTGDSDPFRYFSKQELRELFTLDNPYHSVTQVQLSQLHQRSADEELEKHIQFLKGLGIFGISDHDLMFSRQMEDASEDNDQNAVSDHFIKQKVAAAEDLIKSEASIAAEGIRLASTYCRPYQETIPLYKKSFKGSMYEPPILPEMIDLTLESKSFPQSLSLEEENAVNKKKKEFASSTSDRSRNSQTPLKEIKSHINSPEISSNEKDSSQKCLNRPSLVDSSLSLNEQSSISSGTNKENIPYYSSKEQKCRSASVDNKEPPTEDGLELLDLDIDLDISVLSTGKKRRSCVRQSAFPVDSDISVEEVDSFNTASTSFVPDSASNTPLLSKSQSRTSVLETPTHHSPHLQSDELDAFLQRYTGSARRITPLRVPKNVGQEDEYFAQAMASSIVITPQSSPQNGVVQQSPSAPDSSIEMLDESIIYTRRTARRQILSDSEDEEVSSSLKDNSALDYSAAEANSSQNHFEDQEGDMSVNKKRVIAAVSDSDYERHSSGEGQHPLLVYPSSKTNESINRYTKNENAVAPDSDDDFVKQHSSDQDKDALDFPIPKTNDSDDDKQNDESVIFHKKKVARVIDSDSEGSVSDHSSQETPVAKDLQKRLNSSNTSISKDSTENENSNIFQNKSSLQEEDSVFEHSDDDDYDEESDSGRSNGSASLFDED